MRTHLALIAIAAVTTATAAAAQPGNAGRPATTPTTMPAPVVLASAGDVHQPAPSQSGRPSQSARRPAPRVTTCRCGDPQISQDQAADDQPDQ